MSVPEGPRSRLGRVRVRRLAVALMTMLLAACSFTLPFDELGGGVRSADASDEDVPIDASDGGAGDAGADVRVDSPDDVTTINPTAGFGIFSLRFEQGAAPGMTPVRIEPGDGGLQELGCKVATGVQDEGMTYSTYATAVHYNTADPSRASFVYLDVTLADGGEEVESARVLLASERSGCHDGGEPRVIFTSPAFLPSFSDDGSRVALLVSSLSDDAEARRIVTVSTSAPVSVWPLRDVSGWDGGALEGARPAWFRDSSGAAFVFWAERSPSGEHVIRRARDLVLPPSPANPDDYDSVMRCPASAGDLRQLAVFQFAGGLYVGLVFAPKDPDAGAFHGGLPEIFLVPFGAACSSRARLFDDAPGALSNDMVVSPNGRWLAHRSDRPLVAPGPRERWRIWIGEGIPSASAIGIDGRRSVCSQPPEGADDFGPAFISGGTQIAWTRSFRTTGRMDAFVADFTDGVCANERPATAPKPETNLVSGRSGTCAQGRGTSRSPGVAILSLIGAWAARRRRSRRSAT